MDFSKMIDEISATAGKASSPDDYEWNGLMYCGTCHTPKQCILSNGMKVNCLCACATERREAERQECIELARRQRIEQMRKVGFPDYEMQFCTFDRDDKSNAELSRVALNYVSNFNKMFLESKGLLLYGTVGTGKTFISACIANALMDKGYPCLVTSFARLCNTITGLYEGKQAYIDGLSRFDLLVIDDLAAERDTEYMGEMVQNIIDSRYRSGKPLIVTTNLTGAELMHPADVKRQRLYSRLFEMCFPYEVKGTDRRKKKLNDDDSRMRLLLGLE